MEPTGEQVHARRRVNALTEAGVVALAEIVAEALVVGERGDRVATVAGERLG